MRLVDSVKRFGRAITLSALLAASVISCGRSSGSAQNKISQIKKPASLESVVKNSNTPDKLPNTQYFNAAHLYSHLFSHTPRMFPGGEQLLLGTDTPNDYNRKYYEKFKIPIEEYYVFRDTVKPNAVIIFPTDDHNRAFETIYDKIFVNELRRVYDTRIKWCSTENEVYELLRNTPDIELLVLGGHGTKTQLRLGFDIGSILTGVESERYFIDLGDKEIVKYKKNLKDDCVTILLSCSNAQGGKNAKNLANAVHSWLRHKLIASKTDFSISELEVTVWHPLHATIRNKQNTYILYGTPPAPAPKIEFYLPWGR